MSRSVVPGVAMLVAALASLASAGALAGAQGTGVNGEVGTLMQLSLLRVAPDRVDATITTTVRGTRLSVSGPGGRVRVLGEYRGPMTRRTVVVRSARARAGSTTRTITFGPQGP